MHVLSSVISCLSLHSEENIQHLKIPFEILECGIIIWYYYYYIHYLYNFRYISHCTTTKMKCVVVLLISLAAVVSAFQYTEEWEAWKKEYGRSYESADIELRRQIIWESNMIFVNEHNTHADEFGFTVEMNEFADLVSSMIILCQVKQTM